MTKTFQNIFINKGVKISQVANHAGAGIHLAGYCDLQGVIMPVSVRIVAFTVEVAVLPGWQIFPMQPVGS